MLQYTLHVFGARFNVVSYCESQKLLILRINWWMELSSSIGSQTMIISHLSKLKRYLNRVLSRIYHLGLTRPQSSSRNARVGSREWSCLLPITHLAKETETERRLVTSRRLGEKSRVAKGHELPRGCGGACPMPLREIFWNEYALRCNLVHFETILRNVNSVCTDLIASGWFFRYSYLYTV